MRKGWYPWASRFWSLFDGRLALRTRAAFAIAALLNYFSRIEYKRNPEDVAHTLNEVFLCVCAMIAECDSFDAIADWERFALGFCGGSCRSSGVFPRAAGSTS